MPDLNTVLYQNPTAGPDAPLLGYWQLDSNELTPQISQSPSAAPELNGYEFVGTGNFDGDATDDVLWKKSVGNGQSELYIWFMNPDNTLRESQGITQGNTETFKLNDDVPIQRIADFDGDGKDDLLFRVQNSNLFALWKMDGATADVPQVYELETDPPGSIFDETFAIGDFDGNGIKDLFVRNSATGEVFVGLLDENLNLIPEGDPNGPTQSGPLRLDGAIYNLPGNWELLGVTDLNVAGAGVTDNNDDIVLRNTQTGQVVGWLMNGSSIQAWDLLGAPVTNDFNFEGFGDFNGDGNGDLLWRSKSADGILGMWLTGSTADNKPGLVGANFVTLSGSSNPYSLPAQWEIFGFENVGDAPRFADFNSDGNADIYLHNTVTGQAILWSMNGTVIEDWGFVEFNGNPNPAPAGWQPIGLLSTVEAPIMSTNGLLGEYYNTINFNGPVVLSQVDPEVNFNWGTGSPDPSVNPDNFSVRWSGQVEPLYSEEYTFYTTIDDGVRLIVNGQELIFDDTLNPAEELSGTITLQAGQKYNIIMEYFEATGEASAVLEWSSATQARQVIPQSQLFSEIAKQTIDDLKIYVAPGFSGSNPVDLADWFEDVALRIDLNGDGNLSANETVSSGSFDLVNNSISNPNITYTKTGNTYTFGSSNGVEIWEVNFGNLGLSLPSLSTYDFGVKASGRLFDEPTDAYYPWFMVASNAALSNYGSKAFTDDQYLQFGPTGNFVTAIDSNGNGWNKSSDILVQVFDDNGVLLTDRGLPNPITTENLVRWAADAFLDPELADFLGDDFKVSVSAA